MTVGELIKKLEHLDDNLEIFVEKENRHGEYMLDETIGVFTAALRAYSSDSNDKLYAYSFSGIQEVLDMEKQNCGEILSAEYNAPQRILDIVDKNKEGIEYKENFGKVCVLSVR